MTVLSPEVARLYLRSWVSSGHLAISLRITPGHFSQNNSPPLGGCLCHSGTPLPLSETPLTPQALAQGG